MRRRELLVGTTTLLPSLQTASPTTSEDSMTPLTRLPVAGAKEAVVMPDGRYVVLAVTNGFAIVDCVDPRNPTIVTENRRVVPDHPDGPLYGIWDVAVNDTTLAVVGPAHGDSTNTLTALATYDLSTPSNPTRLAVHETEYPIHNCDIADDIVYLTANDGDRNPMVMVDATTGTEQNRWSIIDADQTWATVPTALRPLHDITIHDSYAVLAHWDAGTWLLDRRPPTDPTPIAHIGPYQPAELAAQTDTKTSVTAESVELPGNNHFATINPEHTLLGIGREAWDLNPDDDHHGGPGGIDLYDITTPDTPTHLTTVNPPSTPNPTVEGVWTTAHNFYLTTNRLYAAWYRGGLTVHDITTPTTPTQLHHWRDDDTASLWTAQPGTDWIAASSRRDPPADDGQGGALYLFPDTPTHTTTSPSTTSTPGQPGFNLLTAATALTYLLYRTIRRD